MLGIDPRAARAAWTVFLVALLVATAYFIRETLVVFMIALLFAYLLMPLVGLVDRFTPKRVPSSFALAIVFLLLIGALVALGFTLGSRLVDEANSLASRLPDLVRNRSWIDQIPLPHWLEPARARISETIQSQLDSGGARYLIYIVLIPILAFFFLKDGRQMRVNAVDSFFPPDRRPIVENILEDINRLLGAYIRALVLLAVTSFVINSLFLGISGAPYAILLAVFAGVGEFLPVVGPAGSALLILLVTGLAGYDHLVLYFIFWILLRLFQDYVMAPYLMGRGVELNPVLVLFGVLAGEQIAGVMGMFFSVPVIATLRVLFVRLQRARAGELVTKRD